MLWMLRRETREGERPGEPAADLVGERADRVGEVGVGEVGIMNSLGGSVTSDVTQRRNGTDKRMP